ncbi:hypothetical protein GCM10022234_21070 [Aeromicrobium panaciterrae]|uniref:hypothetical protein n=1 Tax=Aeromicrobium panaciterrae TaxID=363861 RepID=UPI0031DCE8A7
MILNPEAFVRADLQRRLEVSAKRHPAPSETQCTPCRSDVPRIRLLGALHDLWLGSRVRVS